MTTDEQLAAWLNGNSVHAEQCCPDFSCCEPSLLADEATRRAFVDHPESRDQMCMMFLGAAFASAGKKVYIAGDTPASSHS